MAFVTHRNTSNGPLVNIHLGGTSLYNNTTIYAKEQCHEGIFSLTLKGARRMSRELLTAAEEAENNYREELKWWEKIG